MRTVVYGLEMGASGFELLDHEFVDSMYQRLWEVAAADPGLIRDHNYRHAGFIQAANGFRRVRQNTKSADMIQITDFIGDGAVAIEKNGGP